MQYMQRRSFHTFNVTTVFFPWFFLLHKICTTKILNKSVKNESSKYAILSAFLWKLPSLKLRSKAAPENQFCWKMNFPKRIFSVGRTVRCREGIALCCRKAKGKRPCRRATRPVRHTKIQRHVAGDLQGLVHLGGETELG